MKKIFSVLLLVLMVSFFAVGCGSQPSASEPQKEFQVTDELLKDMAKLDKAYIPPLFLSKQEKEGPTQKGFEMLNTEWGKFYQKYYNANSQDSSWNEDLDKFQTICKDAEKLIGEGKFEEGHDKLESAYAVMRKLRERNNISYYLDILDKFHASMELVTHGTDKEADKLADADIENLKSYLADIKRDWQAVKDAKLDNSVFDLPEGKIAKLEGIMADEDKAIAAFEEALQSGDKAQIVKTGQGIKPNYAKLFTLFGDMEKAQGK